MNTTTFLQKIVGLMEDTLLDEKKNGEMNYVSPEDLQKKLNLTLGLPVKDEKLLQLFKEIVAYTPKAGSKLFLNQLYGGRNIPAIGAEMLASGLNTSMYTYKVAGPHVLVEQELIAKACACIGFKEGEGTLSPGGSLANFTAMLLARNECDPDSPFEGLRKTIIAYTSTASHYSIRKSVGFLGIGKNNLRIIQTDKEGKMDCESLEKQIVEDKKQGFVPFFVNSTAGSTVLGTFDPIEKIQRIATKYSMWHHVDGALGTSAVVSAKHRHLLKGIDRVDSVTWNIHKLLGVPMPCSLLLTREKGVLRKHLNEKAKYLFQTEEDQYNLGTKSVQCGRRNDAFKAWALWKSLGDKGLESHVDYLFDLAKHAAHVIISKKELTLIEPVESVCVCFFVNGIESKVICDVLNRRHGMKIGYGTVDGKDVIRLVCVNPELEYKDIELIIEKIVCCSDEIRSGTVNP